MSDSDSDSDFDFDDVELCTELFSETSEQKHVQKHIGVQRLALKRKFTWPNGSTLRVRFIKLGDHEASDNLKTKVKNYALQWTNYANLKFDFVTEAPADIRVSFKQNGSYWSMVGTSSKSTTSQDEPTMNLSLENEDSDDDDDEVAAKEKKCRRHTLHEFGHAIGCIHEHQSPAADIPWDKEKVYKYYKKKMGWSKEQVDHNIFYHYTANTVDYSAFDKKSIMLYHVSASLTTNGYSTGWNTELSDTDKSFIAKAYPSTDEIDVFDTDNDRKTVVDGQTNSDTVDFENTLAKPPQVVVGLCALDISNGAKDKAIRVKAYADSITTDDFIMHVDSWGDTRLYNASVSWFEVATDDIYFQSGVCDITCPPGETNVTQKIEFKTPFASTPKVFSCYSGIDLDSVWCCDMLASVNDNKSFNLSVNVNPSSNFYGARVDWIAFPAEKQGISTGFFGGDVFSGHVDFDTLFTSPPQVFFAINSLEIDSSHNLCVKLTTESITTTGMDWKIETWDDSVLECVYGSYLAVAM